MALRTIVVRDNEFLHKKSRAVTAFDDKLATLLDDMGETLHHSDGVGLAAPQVGLLRRVVVIDVGEGIIELVNPEIVERKGKQDGPEGCLSYPGEWGMVKRPMHVKVKAYDRSGKPFFIEGDELLARAFCHELDHLDGVVFKDLASRMLEADEV